MGSSSQGEGGDRFTTDGAPIHVASSAPRRARGPRRDRSLPTGCGSNSGDRPPVFTVTVTGTGTVTDTAPLPSPHSPLPTPQCGPGRTKRRHLNGLRGFELRWNLQLLASRGANPTLLYELDTGPHLAHDFDHDRRCTAPTDTSGCRMPGI